MEYAESVASKTLLEHKEEVGSDAKEQGVYALAYAAYQRGDYSLSARLFRQLVLSAPFECDYWKGLAAAEQMQNDYMAALHAWGLVALLQSQDPTPHFHAAECYFFLSELTESRKALKVAESLCGQTHPLELSWQMIKQQLERMQ